MGDARKVHVSVYSDYTCPWCYVGAARLERLKDDLSGEVDIIDTWMPFEIHAEVPEEGMPIEALPYSKEQFDEITDYLRRQAAREGLELGRRQTLSNTHRALAAGTHVQHQHADRFRAFHMGLFRAYFEHGRDLNDVDVLRGIALEAGIDPDDVAYAMHSGEYENAIAATAEIARRLGISATPTFVFENAFAVVGAQPVETLRRAVEEALEKKTTSAVE